MGCLEERVYENLISIRCTETTSCSPSNRDVRTLSPSDFSKKDGEISFDFENCNSVPRLNGLVPIWS